MAGHRNTFLRFQFAQPFWWIICVFGRSWATPTGSYVAEPLNNWSRPDERRRLVLFRRSTVSSRNTFLISVVVLLGAMACLFALKLRRGLRERRRLRRSLVHRGQYMENEVVGGAPGWLKTAQALLETSKSPTDGILAAPNMTQIPSTISSKRQTLFRSMDTVQEPINIANDVQAPTNDNVRQTSNLLGVQQLQFTVNDAIGGPQSPSPSSSGETSISSRDGITDIDSAEGGSNITLPPRSYSPAVASYRTTSIRAYRASLPSSLELTKHLPGVRRATSWRSRDSPRRSTIIRSPVRGAPHIQSLNTTKSSQVNTTEKSGVNITAPEATYSFLYRPWSGSLSNDRNSQATELTRLPSYRSSPPSYSATRSSFRLSITE